MKTYRGIILPHVADFTEEQVKEAMDRIAQSEWLSERYKTQCTTDEQRTRFILDFCIQYFDVPGGGTCTPCIYCVHSKSFPQTDKCTFYLSGVINVPGLLDKLLNDEVPLERRCKYFEEQD